ncbi:MAG: hypothetical protein ACRD10_09490, partial [Terriglobia bacterium]
MVAVPITISGKNAKGEPFREETYSISINQQGARLATWQTINCGSELLIENLPRGMAAKAKVVSFTEKASPSVPHQIGVELRDPKNIWGIQYPPPDWRRPAVIATTRPVPSPIVSAAPAAMPQQTQRIARATPSPLPAATLDVDLGDVAKAAPGATKPEPVSFQPEADSETLFRA